MKRDASVATCGIITFGTEAAELFEALTPEAKDAAFLDLAESVADRLNTTLHGLVVHMDETTIHAHYQLAAYNRDGVPLSQATRPAVMSGLQDLTAEVMARHCAGIERGHRYGDRIAAGADFKDTLHRTVRELHRDLPQELESKRTDIAKLEGAKQEAQIRVDEMRERVQKLEAKAELTDKESKRLETYLKRLEARISDQEAAQEAAEHLAQIAREEAAEAVQHRDWAKIEETSARKKAQRITAAIQVLSKEIADETIQRNDDGTIFVSDREGLKQGFPEIKPALFATADAMSAKKRISAENAANRAAVAEARKKAEADQEAAAQFLKDAESIRNRLKRHLGLVRMALQRFARFLTPDEVESTKAIMAETETLTAPPKKSRDGCSVTGTLSAFEFRKGAVDRPLKRAVQWVSIGSVAFGLDGVESFDQGQGATGAAEGEFRAAARHVDPACSGLGRGVLKAGGSLGQQGCGADQAGLDQVIHGGLLVGDGQMEHVPPM